MKWSRRGGYAAALAVVAATNVVVLGGAAYNRGGQPESELRLSQREASPPHVREKRDNSGLALALRWRVAGADWSVPRRWYPPGPGGSPEWLDEKKMALLGFDVSLPEGDERQVRSFQRQRSREVLLVLELDGPTYRKSLERAVEEGRRLEAEGKKEAAREGANMVERERNRESRLFVVDAGVDVEALRVTYPDRSRYAIVRGRVVPAWRMGSGRGKTGNILDVSVSSIHVPYSLRPVFEGITPTTLESGSAGAGYEVLVPFGRRLEPWLAAATAKPVPGSR